MMPKKNLEIHKLVTQACFGTRSFVKKKDPWKVLLLLPLSKA